MRFRAALVTVLATLALTTPSLLGGAVAGASIYARGPDPTPALLEGSVAPPYGVAKVAVANSLTPGFGAATIYSPTGTPQWPANGTFGGVAIVPGFTGTQASIAWLGPRLASQGFVVITLDTNSPFDQPAARGTQLRAALTYLTNSSPVKTQVDGTRLAVMGHSMGGGGALEAAKANIPALQATIGLMPWHTDKTWPEVVSASLVVGAERDTTAPVGSHAIPLYTGMTKAPEKVYLELNEAGHSLVTSVHTTVASHSIAWLKRFVDSDARYSQFICPGPAFDQHGTLPVANYQSTCDV